LTDDVTIKVKTALLVIDFQNAVFMEPPAYQAQLVLGRIASLIDQARAARVPVIYVQHGQPGTEWEQGTVTWRFPEAIAPRADEHISAKSHSDAFRHTGLERYLASQGIGKLIVCGYASEYCIDTNVRSASSLEFDVVVVADAHTTRDRAHLPADKIIAHHNAVWASFAGPQVSLSLAQDVKFVR
jgi:nicotinamidase-related amidase